MINNTWIFIQDSEPSHRASIVQDFFKEKMGKRFMKHTEWPPSSPDCNPQTAFSGTKCVKKKCMKTDSTNPLQNELKRKIKKVQPEVAHDLTSICKALKLFKPRLKAVEEKKFNQLRYYSNKLIEFVLLSIIILFIIGILMFYGINVMSFHHVDHLTFFLFFLFLCFDVNFVTSI